MKLVTKNTIIKRGDLLPPDAGFSLSNRTGVASFRQTVTFEEAGVPTLSLIDSASVFCSSYSFLLYRGSHDTDLSGSKLSVLSVVSRVDIVPANSPTGNNPKVVVTGNITMIPFYDYASDTQKNFMVSEDAWNNTQLDLCVVAIGQ